MTTVVPGASKPILSPSSTLYLLPDSHDVVDQLTKLSEVGSQYIRSDRVAKPDEDDPDVIGNLLPYEWRKASIPALDTPSAPSLCKSKRLSSV
jgi:hypothetical protein